MCLGRTETPEEIEKSKKMGEKIFAGQIYGRRIRDPNEGFGPIGVPNGRKIARNGRKTDLLVSREHEG